MNMIGQYPQDTPDQSAVAVVYRLSEGYVLMIRGRTIACPSIHALGQAVTKQLKLLEQEPQAEMVMQDVPVGPTPPELSTRPEQFVSQPGPQEQMNQPFAEPDAQAFYQRNNLIISARALVDGTITEDVFNQARRVSFPDIDEQVVLSVAQSFGWASTRVQHSSDELAGLPRGDEELRPEEPDPDGEDGFDPNMPVTVVDLAAGREGRRAAREARAQAEATGRGLYGGEVELDSFALPTESIKPKPKRQRTRKGRGK
jgi:hypothetical protein